MRKLFILVCLCLFASTVLVAQRAEKNMQQVLVPREVFVGDSAELRYTFQSPVDFYAVADASCVQDGMIYLDVNDESFTRYAEAYSVKRIVLQRVGITYTLIITFVPWKPGVIDFDAFDLNQLCGGKNEDAAFMIQLDSVEIASLSERTGVTSVRPPVSPLLLPGTSYVVWSCIIIVIMLLILLGIVIARFSSIVHTVLTFSDELGYRRNARMTHRRLHFLLRRKYTDVQFAEQWQRIMRSYLAYRFGTSFASVTAKNIASVITLVTGDMLNIDQENAVLSLASLFTRTDYIRFAGGSIDSRLLPAAEHEAMFAYDERKNIIELTCVDIRELEAQEQGGGSV